MAASAGAVETFRHYIEVNRSWINAPGIAVAFTDKEQLLGLLLFGRANMATGELLTPGALFQIASMSKAFASIAVLRLQEQGRLDIGAPVSEYLPWFAIRSDYEPIRLNHIMSHTSGLITGTEATASASSQVWDLRYTDVSTPPGTYFHYSNTAYKILGLIMERILGKGIAEIMREYVLDPMGMNESEAVITSEIRPRLAVGYEPLLGDRPLSRGGSLAEAPWFEFDSTDGSICSNASDMAKYMRVLLNRGGGLLSYSSFETLTRPAITMENDIHGRAYGLGLGLDTMNGAACLVHWGQMVGYRGSVVMDLDDGLGVVILANGPWESRDAARIGLTLLQGRIRHEELPLLLEPMDPHRITNAADYAGCYQSEQGEISFVSEGDALFLLDKGILIPLERHPEISLDAFYAKHPGFSRYLLRFGRHEGKVVDVYHGGQAYFHLRHEGRAGFSFPDRWRNYVGHYVSHNPWLTNFRVHIRKGKLVWIQPDGQEEVLSPLGEDVFRVSEDPRSPERMRFGMLIEGKAHLAEYSGAAYHRTFTP